ncbi:MAG TPA: hypothetical protein G4N94_03935 [Caldilineae bacterium]|nr:hypothetical protein [Caldilineae bacterium]
MKTFSSQRAGGLFALSVMILWALLLAGPGVLAGSQATAGDDDVPFGVQDELAIASWLQQAKLSASDGVSGHLFGVSVAISGDTVVVGSSGGDQGKGLVYVFEKPGGGWASATEIAQLSASDGVAGDGFGWSVAISGDTVVVGVSDGDKGVAYVFEKPGDGWANATETAVLSASDGAAGDYFGRAVAVSGDTVVVGAEGDESSKGSAYVFEKPGGGWANATETAKLSASDGAGGDQFGNSVAINGDTVVAGAHGVGSNSGSAYVFEKPGGGWANTTETAKLSASDGMAGDLFGHSVAISVDAVVVGASGDDTLKGSAYVFEKPDGGWASATETAKLSASGGAANDYFGISVAIDGDTVAVGAEGDDSFKGLAYVFEKPGGGWVSATETVVLSASDGATNGYFGGSVAISGDTVVAGTEGDDDSKGSAYVFENSPVWRFRGYTYQGQPPATFARASSAASTPIGGVTLTLYGRSQNEPAPGAWHTITQSGADGFYNFFIVQPWVFDIFRLEAEPPDGMVVSGISTETGQVVADNAIEWYGPPPQVHFSDFYFDEPTPTPTATSTPTSTPTPTPTFTPTNTPTPTPTFTPTPTITPTATPVTFDIWLPLVRR